jgi:hypothetical protein
MLVNHATSAIEIRSVLIDAMNNNKQFVIWQRNNDGEITFKVNAKLISVSEKSVMKFEFSGKISLARNVQTFFAVEETTLVFKVPKIAIHGDVIFAALPSEAKYAERRRHKRTQFSLKDSKQVKVSFNYKEDENSDWVITTVMDISESGICLLVPKETFSKINTSENFDISAISDDLGFEDHQGKIMNARVFKQDNEIQKDFYAIGVMFI